MKQERFRVKYGKDLAKQGLAKLTKRADEDKIELFYFDQSGFN